MCSACKSYEMGEDCVMADWIHKHIHTYVATTLWSIPEVLFALWLGITSTRLVYGHNSLHIVLPHPHKYTDRQSLCPCFVTRNSLHDWDWYMNFYLAFKRHWSPLVFYLAFWLNSLEHIFQKMHAQYWANYKKFECIQYLVSRLEQTFHAKK